MCMHLDVCTCVMSGMYNWTSDLCGHIKCVKPASICRASEVMDSVLLYAQLTRITLS